MFGPSMTTILSPRRTEAKRRWKTCHCFSLLLWCQPMLIWRRWVEGGGRDRDADPRCHYVTCTMYAERPLMCGKHPLMGPEGQQRVELRQWQLVSASLPSERRPHWVALRTFVAPVDLRYRASNGSNLTFESALTLRMNLSDIAQRFGMPTVGSSTHCRLGLAA